MRKRLIIVCVAVILVYSIFGCTQIVENTFAPETEIVESEDTEAKNEEMADAGDAESEGKETSISGEEYGQDEEQTEPIADEPEEEAAVDVDSTSQLNIIGRTQEETNLIKEILAKHEEEFRSFLTEDWEYPHIQWWVEVDGCDFTGDGEEEIIVSKCDVLQDMTVSYNYVYDREDNKLLEFVGDLTYQQLFDTAKTEEFSLIGSILYWEPDGFVWRGPEQGTTDTMDYGSYLRKIWIVDRDERIMEDDRFDFVITKAENAEIKGYIQLGGGVEVYYFEHLQKNDPKYCSFQGTIYDGKAECTFTYEEHQVELHLTLCENDRIEASIQCDDLEINESFKFRPYNISDEPLGDDISSAEIWLESWGTVYLVTATMDILHPYPFACLTNEKQDILYRFGYGINGSQVWDFFIEDINRDGLQDILAVAWFDESGSYRFVNIMFQKEDGRFQKDNGLQIDGPKDDRAALSEKYYGDYRIAQFCPTADYEECAGEVLTEQELNTMLGSTVQIRENLLVTYDSERRRGTNQNRQMPSGDNMVEEFYDDYAYCSWHPVTPEVIADFLSMDSVKFSEKYDRDDLNYSGILYCGLEAWKYNGSMLSAFQEKYYDVENVMAIRFYKKQPVLVYPEW